MHIVGKYIFPLSAFHCIPLKLLYSTSDVQYYVQSVARYERPHREGRGNFFCRMARDDRDLSDVDLAAESRESPDKHEGTKGREKRAVCVTTPGGHRQSCGRSMYNISHGHVGETPPPPIFLITQVGPSATYMIGRCVAVDATTHGHGSGLQGLRGVKSCLAEGIRIFG